MWGVLEMNLRKVNGFCKVLEGNFKKLGTFFELSAITLDTRPVSRKTGIDLLFLHSLKAQENHQRKESWGPNSCIIFHTTK